MTERNDSPAHASSAGELIRLIDGAMEAKFGRRIGIGLFLFDLTAALLIEWLGTNEPTTLQQAVERWRAQGILGRGAERTQ